MPKLELDFLPDGLTPSDEQLFLQLVYGLCGQIRRPGEEKCHVFVSSVGIPVPEIRRLAKLLVAKLGLPIPVERVDEWVDWQQRNSCWFVSDELVEEARRLQKLESK